MNKRILKILELLLGAVILFYLIYKLGAKKVYETILLIDPNYLILPYILQIIVILIGAFNIYLFVKFFRYKKLRFQSVLIVYLYNLVIGMVFPIRSVGIPLIVLLNKLKIKMKHSIAITFVDKIITFVILLLFTLVGILYFSSYSYNLLIYSTLLLIITILLGIFLFTKKLQNRIINLFERLNLPSIRGFSESSKKLIKSKKNIIVNSILTFIKLLISSIIPYIILLGLDIHPPLLQFSLIAIVITVISSFPISIGGLGIREVGATALFSYFMGLDSVLITSAYIIFLFIRYSFAIIFLLLYNFNIIKF